MSDEDISAKAVTKGPSGEAAIAQLRRTQAERIAELEAEVKSEKGLHDKTIQERNDAERRIAALEAQLDQQQVRRWKEKAELLDKLLPVVREELRVQWDIANDFPYEGWEIHSLLEAYDKAKEAENAGK